MSRLAENVIVAGSFRLVRKLGQGGMGSVWQATQLGLDAPCAIKFIEGLMTPEIKQRFEREAKAAAALRSPHVVQIIDHATWDGIPFIAMELLVGEDLRHRLAPVGKLSVAETLEILGQVCRALHKAHGLGIVHRDLKPDNIFLVRDDDHEIAKVLDFGIAKSTKDEPGVSTRTGAMLGTPYYMSPEQAQGTRGVDFRTDLWAMAVIAFQCLTGRLPFQSDALGDLLIRLMVAPLPRPSAYGNVPPGFDAWWLKAASRDPAGRFGSAKEFIESLSAALLSTTAAPLSSTSSVLDDSSPALSIGAATPFGIQNPRPQTSVFPASNASTALPPSVPRARSKGPLIALVVVGMGAFGVIGGGLAALKLSTAARPFTSASSSATVVLASAIASSTAAFPTPSATVTATPIATESVTTTTLIAPPSAIASAPVDTIAPHTHGQTHATPHASASAAPSAAPTSTARDLGF